MSIDLRVMSTTKNVSRTNNIKSHTATAHQPHHQIPPRQSHSTRPLLFDPIQNIPQITQRHTALPSSHLPISKGGGDHHAVAECQCFGDGWMAFFGAVCENASVNEQDYGSQFGLIDGLTDFNGDGEGGVAGWDGQIGCLDFNVGPHH
jgi:hypothetical protein